MSSIAGTHGTVRSSALLRGKFASALVVSVAIVALHVGRGVFIPLGLATLIAFAFDPVVLQLRRLKFGHLAAVMLTVALVALVAGAIAMFLAAQFAELATTVPAPHKVAPAIPLLTAFNEPLPVQVANALAEPLLNPMASAGLAVLFAAFLLLQRDGLASRFARFAAAGDARRKSAQIGSAARTFGRRLLVQGLLDLSFGALIAVGLWTLGVPNPGLWAVFAVMLRSVPFVGVPVAALCPLMLAVSIDPTALLVCETLLLFLAVDGALRLIERRWLHHALPRLSALAAVGATVAWTVLWGLTGLLLATPLTLGFVMLGRHFEPLRFLDALLAGAVAAPPASETAGSIRLPFGTGAKAARAADPMRALALAQRELAAGAMGRLDRVKMEAMIAGTVRTLAPAILARGEDHALALRPWNLAPDWQQDPVLCVAGPGLLDEAAAALVAAALKRKGLSARVISFEETLHANLPRMDISGTRAICLSCLDPRDSVQLRQTVRRLRPRARSAKFIAGLWGWDPSDLMDGCAVECDLVAVHPREAASQIARLARNACAPQTAGAETLDFVPVALAA